MNSFDGDWGNAELWAPFTYDYLRAFGSRPPLEQPRGAARIGGAAERRRHRVARGCLRPAPARDGHDISLGEFADPAFPEFDSTLDEFLDSRYRASNVAIFGQLDGRLTERVRWSAGLRGEQRSADYDDAGLWQGIDRASDLDSKDRMAGGQLSLSFDVSRDATWYTSLSRGYKAGGFNLGSVPPERLAFEPEYLWSFEAGLKRSWLDGQLYSDTTLFYSKRRNVQVRTGEQLDPGDPNSYVFFTDNASTRLQLRSRVQPALAREPAMGVRRHRWACCARATWTTCRPTSRCPIASRRTRPSISSR